MKQDLPVIYGPSSLGDITSLKGDLQDTVGAILKKEILQGTLLRGALSSDPTAIAHNLGRPYVGYIVVKRETWHTANNILKPDIPFTGSIFESKSEDSGLFINLYSPGITVDLVDYDVVANVWVF